MSDFFQEPPQLKPTFSSDPLLQNHLKTCLSTLSGSDQKNIFSHLEEVGQQAVGNWLTWSREAEAQNPVHTPFDPWGNRIDDIWTSSGWKNLEKAAATEGIVATAYERKFGWMSRVYQLALLYLYHPSSAFFSCPLAMTDGAARALEIYGDDELRGRAFRNLTSRDPLKFWTSGQWMTEKTGGSDVSGTETVARQIHVKKYALNGVKWFTSATTSQMTLTLARPEGAEAGSRGLSLFYLELRKASGQFNGLSIHRLKDKLGTKALPTAEISLQNSEAQLVGELGGGVKKIASVLNITRMYNSICALGHMRRALDLAQDYSLRRKAFGKKLSEHPLHRATLQNLEETFSKCFRLTFFVAALLGKEETKEATAEEKILLRALTPIVKLYTGKKVIEICSEVCEIFGGAGYVEDTGIPKLFRDAQVFSIWEGTTNVLSLDFLRTLEKDKAGAVLSEILEKNKNLLSSKRDLASALKTIQDCFVLHSQKQTEKLEERARELSFAVAEVFSAVDLSILSAR